MNRFYEAWQVLTRGGRRPDSGVQYDDAIPFIGSDMNPSDILKLINDIKSLSSERIELNKEYDRMAQDGILGSVLELISDECNVKDEINNMSYWVECSDKELENYINTWLRDEIKIDSMSWNLAYNIAKYGEVFLKTNKNEDKARRFFNVGDYFEVVANPSKVSHLMMYGTTIGYQYESPVDDQSIKQYTEDEFIHVYRDLGAHFYTEAQYTDKDGQLYVEDVKVVYGTSFLESSRQAFMILDLLDTMLLSTRVNRSQLIRLIKTEVGSANAVQTRKIIGEVKQAFKVSSMKLSESYKEGNRNSTISNVYIPIRQGKGDTQVEEMGGNSDIRDIADIEYYTDKLIASTRVPKAFLGLDSTLTAGLGQNSLTRVDIRYARMIKAIKNLVCECITAMVRFKLDNSPFKSTKDFEVCTVPVSTAEENEKYAAYSEKMNFVSQLIDLLSQSERVDSDKLVEYVLDYMLDVPDYKRFYMSKKVDNPVTGPGNAEPEDNNQNNNQDDNHGGEE